MNNAITFYSNGSISVDHKTLTDSHIGRRNDGKSWFRSSNPKLAHMDKTVLSFEYNDEHLRHDITTAL